MKSYRKFKNKIYISLSIIAILGGVLFIDKLVSICYVYYYVKPVLAQEFSDSNVKFVVPQTVNCRGIKQTDSLFSVSLLRCIINRHVFVNKNPYQKMAQTIHFGLDVDGQLYYWSFAEKDFVSNNSLACFNSYRWK